MTERQKQIRQRLKDDFIHYSQRCLSIRSKSGGLDRLVLNRAQLHLHQAMKEQRRKKGRVRVFVLKGRQQGCSTYVGARFFHRVTHGRGMRAFILAHDMEASRNLFAMTKRFYRNCPVAVRPVAGKDNERELAFPRLGSGYRVGTAGSRSAGRSMTVQYFHGSEVAFWPNAREHVAGVLQTVPDAPGSEVVFESTANGMGNFFHAGWQAAEAGDSGYEAVFLPWFWQREYRSEVGDEFRPDDEERHLMAVLGLTPPQLVWRRFKIRELGDPLLFRQEYPCTPDEAFQNTGEDSFIQAADVLRARKTEEPGSGPVVVGVDPARFGDDRTAMVFRQGRRAFGLRSWSGKDTMEVAGLCRRVLESDTPRVERLFVDAGGLGAGVVDRLREMGFGLRVSAVQFGGRAASQERYRNKRAEMWGELREWLTGELPVSLPDEDALQSDLTGPGYSYDSQGRLVLEPKERMRQRGLRSPDIADALALTFAAPVRRARPQQRFADRGEDLWLGERS
ncbi:hypothetical protein [Desulfovibrio ferrophilus]|uniref:Terminase large subunit gp17-like C-terminal domain-containing protein n=1 Tax=Desulfovibrio ferrophilus TaxID=241368 RepID=A0A2Z6AZW4_9BACT|nr:hypothetical protein [Desulfovibrio ferrophilus]BBD08758.1 uncharacterized protein DFE_2032 [Desulfovibrio ferrophilus]